MAIVNSILGAIFSLFFFLFQGFDPWIGMIVVSLITALFMLFIYRFTSNQEGIRKVKDKIKAHLLELRLFKDDMVTTFRAQGNILKYNLRYIGYSARPMLVMIIPLILFLIQLNLWFGYQALAPGQSALLKVKLDESYNPMEIDVAVEPPSGLVLETPPLRIEEEKEIDWRIRAEKSGLYDLGFKIAGEKITKKVTVGGRPLARISPARVQRGFLDELFNPGESPIPKNSPVAMIEIVYPAGSMNLFGWPIYWPIVYFILSIILGFALKGFFRIEI
ncbi:MAG: hypothetical protein AB1756_01860 [Acidobacteriota bacterium]